MIIIDWNCGGEFREKYIKIDKISWDILVVQHCEKPEHVIGKTNGQKYYEWAKVHQCLWIGDNENCGLGIFSKENIKVKNIIKEFSNNCSEELDWAHVPAQTSKQLKYFLPICVNDDFILVGVYAKNPKKIAGIQYRLKNQYEYQYMGQIGFFLDNNKEKFRNTKCIITGDFNDNPRLKSTSKTQKEFFRNVVNKFTELEFSSVYHKYNKIKNESIGFEEEDDTCDYNGRSAPCMIDYMFISKQFNINNFKIIKQEGISDHSILEMDFD
jgi:exonuclease III